MIFMTFFSFTTTLFLLFEPENGVKHVSLGFLLEADKKCLLKIITFESRSGSKNGSDDEENVRARAPQTPVLFTPSLYLMHPN